MIQAQAPLPPGLHPNYVFTELVPVVAILAMIVTGALGLRWIFRTPVGEAAAHRIREGRRSKKGELADPATQAVLEERVTQLQESVSELAEPLDFAERLLTEQQRSRKLGPEP
jgi:hypothetical protein